MRVPSACKSSPEFYSAATRKLKMPSREAQTVMIDLGSWLIHSPSHGDVIRAAGLARKHQIGLWDALVVNSA